MFLKRIWITVVMQCLLWTVAIHSGYANDRISVPAYLYAEMAIENNRLSQSWIDAIKSRLDRKTIDSLGSIVRSLTDKEMQWASLIQSKLIKWNSFKDSLTVPFDRIKVSDTIRILMGSRWRDDGFTFGLNTVCFDLTALQQNYGDAFSTENNQRIDRLFAHEFTHLIHKTWFLKNGYRPVTFRDSIFWECMYEGIGMYRSLSPKWFPVNGKLPDDTRKAMAELIPVFKTRINMLDSGAEFSTVQKSQIQQGLSRGAVNRKWGAFTIAIWLALEADGDERKLIPLLRKNPEDAVRYLLLKYN